MSANMSIEQINELIRAQITEILANRNVQKRNQVNVETFAYNIIQKKNKKTKKYHKYWDSKSVNGILYAPTQVGKSEAIGDFIEMCLVNNVPGIISTANKVDQNELLYSRMMARFAGSNVCFMQVNRSFDKTFEKCIKEKNNRFVIFCLDNASQIKKLIKNIEWASTSNGKMENIKKFAIVHDEADTITKDSNTCNINDDQAVSHKKWIELINVFNGLENVDLKRIFVTATPENCLMMYEIDNADLIQLEIPSNYRGYKDIKCTPFEDDLGIKELLKDQVLRVKAEKTNEVILYCVERKIMDGQNVVLRSIADHVGCIVNTYNGKGITVVIKNQEQQKLFISELVNNKIKFVQDNDCFTIKKITIRKFYTICKKIGETCVITIGKDLIARGISYVSEDQIDPLTATTIIFIPGMTLNAVAIAQAIGRVTGTASPGYTRRLFAPEDVINTYLAYNRNQEAFIKKIRDSLDNQLTMDIIDEMTDFEKFKRPIDRKKLGLKMKMIEPEHGHVHGEIDGVDLAKLNKWINDDSLVGKMVRYLYDQNEEITIEEFKYGVGYTETIKEFTHNVDSGRGVNCACGKLWTSSNNNQCIKLNVKIKNYMDNTRQNI